MARKVQVPVVGGLRKVVQVGTGQTTTVGTTIAEVGSNTITLAQLAQLITNLQTQQSATGNGNVGGGGVSASLVLGPGLGGGGVLSGAVPLRLTAPLPYLMGEDGEDGWHAIPGNRGASGVNGTNGATGGVGPAGAAIFMSAEDGIDGDWGPPGAQGIQGIQGPQGPSGSGGSGATTFIVMDGQDGEDSYIPGPQGIRGAQGAQGSSGSSGATTFIVMDGQDGEDGFIGPPGATGATGSSGGTSIAEPAKIGGLVYWLDGSALAAPATKIVPILGSPDQTRCPFSVQGTSGGPAVTSTPQNGLNALTFSASSACNLTIETPTFTLHSATIFAVCKQIFGSGGYSLLSGNSSALNLQSTNAGGFGLASDYTVEIGVSTGSIANNTWGQMNVTSNDSSGAYSFRIARTADASGTGTFSIGAATDSIGYNKSGGSSAENFDGDIGEILVYNRVLSLTEIESVENYLYTKWGV